jgi:tetratricopeptide (TPR) repeat protein
MVPPRVVAISMALIAFPIASGFAPRPDQAAPSLNEPGRQPLLAFYYEQLDRDGDLDAFQARVQARYSEATLRRLVSSSDVRARRGAVSALGLIGDFGSNRVLGPTLADEDPVVRQLAVQALWSVWFRAGTDEQNATLRLVVELNNRGLTREAQRQATRLIAEAPNFAEAYNQRAIASFVLGEFVESAADCNRALELNPYHFGALGGLGQCYLRLGRPDLALETYRRSLAIQPHDEGLKRLIEALEAE